MYSREYRTGVKDGVVGDHSGATSETLASRRTSISSCSSDKRLSTSDMDPDIVAFGRLTLQSAGEIESPYSTDSPADSTIPFEKSEKPPWAASPSGTESDLTTEPHNDETKDAAVHTRETLSPLSNGSPALEAVTPKPSMSRPHELAFIFVVCLAQFLSLGGMNQTVAPVMILAEYFDIKDYGTLSWFSAAYSMSVGTFILPAGRLGDMYGHKKIFLIGWAWFAVWSVISGFCYKWGVVIFSMCRGFQGIGPALLVPNAIALIGRTFPVGLKRNTVFACFGAAGPTGATAGAVFAAIFAQLVWWPWTFWALAMVCVAVIVLSYFIIPDPDPLIRAPPGERPEFDYLGCFTGVTGLVLLNFALNQAPLTGWGEPYIIALTVLGVFSLIAFAFVELYLTTQPLIPIRGLQFEAVYALGCIAAGWGSHGIWAYYLYLFLEHLKGDSALLTSAKTAPVALTGVLFAFSTVWLLRRVAVSFVMLAAMLIFLVGSLLLALVPLRQTYWLQTFLSVLIMPGAMNLSFPAATILLSSALPKDKQGIAASLVSTMVNYCISCGLGFAGSIHRYGMEHAARRKNGDAKLIPLAQSSPEIVQARLDGMRGPWWFAVGLSGLGVIIATCFILRTRNKGTR